MVFLLGGFSLQQQVAGSPERSTGSKKACLVSTGIVLVLKEFG